MTESFDTPGSVDSAVPRKRGIIRVLIWMAGLVPVLAGISLWVVTRSWFLILVTAPGLERQLGADVRIGDATYYGNGKLVFEDVIISCPGITGPAGQAARIGRAVIVIDPTTLLSGVIVREIQLDDLLLRISENRRNPGQFNFSSFRPRWDRKQESLPPTVRINSAVIEFGTHQDEHYSPRGRRRVAGEMYPATERAWYDFRLQELDENNISLGQAGLSIEGNWNAQTMEHTARIEGLVFDDRMYAMCPQMARLWWERMDPDGRVSLAEIKWSKGEPASAELTVDRMSLTIPLGAREFSASYQFGEVQSVASLPRMHVNAGKIRLVGNQLTLDQLKGEFGSTSDVHEVVQMPYRVDFAIHDMPQFDWKHPQDWMEQVLKTAPFEMSVWMEDFRLDQDTGEDPKAVELPRPVADTLAKFNLTGWSLTTQVEISRAEPTYGADGTPIASQIKTTGQAYIEDAVGAFQGFPYPLDNVRAHAEFDTERIVIHYLTADGSDDAKFRMSGWLAAPGRDRSISLNLTGRNIPLDDRFREGLTHEQRGVFDVMLHEPSYKELLAEGLLPDLAAIDEARRQRQLVVAELDAATGDDVMPLERRLDALNTLIDAGPFKLGGAVDLDLMIVRQPGPDGSIGITGTVTVDKAGIVYGRFPYPIYLLGGVLEVKKDRIVIADGPDGEGIPIATPGGGHGRVTGEVRLERTPHGPLVKPAILIDLHQDALSDLLYAAMPLTEQDRKATAIPALRPVPRRSLIARLLAGSGIEGWLNHTGFISADDAGHPTFDFAVELYDATATPNAELFETMTELGLPSPRGLELDGVHALVQITPDVVRLVDFTGTRGDARITADADVDLKANPIRTNLQVEFDDLDIERYLIELTPGSARQTTTELWDRYRPQGKYDAQLRYHSRGDVAKQAELIIWPKQLRLTIDDEPLWLNADQGRIVLNRGQVTFRGFNLKIQSGNRDEGMISLDGSYGVSTDGDSLRLEGTWQDGQLASPLITEALDLIGAGAHATRYDEFDPSGAFDAEFSFRSPRTNRPAEYEFTVRPRTLGFRINDTPVFADMAPGSQLSFRPGRITLKELSGEHAGGVFRIDGEINVSDLLDADVEIDYHGRVDSPQLLALLPARIREVVTTLKLQGEEPVQLNDAQLTLKQVSVADNTWETDFKGLLTTTGAALNLGGVELTGIDGLFDIRATNTPDTGTSLEVNIAATRVLAMGRELTDVQTHVSMIPGSRSVSLPRFRARMYNGVIAGYAEVGLDDDSRYEATFTLGAVALEGVLSPESAAENKELDVGGEIYASLRIGGLRNQPQTRRGRGAIRVVYGRMADMPIALRVMQLFELMPPVSGTLDFADIAFYVNGDRLVFERLFMECPTLQVLGDGEMRLPGFELDLRLRTRGTLPLIRDIVAAVSDVLFEVEVTGTIMEPKARLIALPGMNQGHSSRVAAPLADADN
jgi:hypothetical protein